MEFIKRNSRFVIAGIALLMAFALSIRFSDRGWQFDLERGGKDAFASPESSRAAGYDLAGTEVLDKVLLFTKEKYVDATRIDPNKMLVYALDEVQKSVPEVVIQFDRDLDDSPTKATVQVRDQTRDFKLGKLESMWQISFEMKKIFGFLQEHLQEREDLKFSDIEYAAVNGMLNTLDPHSVLLNPEIYKEMQTQTGGKFGGLGIVIGIRDGFLTVISPMEGTPASRAGIKTGDQILRINDESTINMSLSDAVSKLRGDPGTKVTIWVKRKSWPDTKPIDITRAIIKIQSVESHLLSNKIGYVKIKSFQANTTAGLRKSLQDMRQKAGGLNGLVLDLRNNPGGLLEQAVKVSDTFLNEGTIVSTVGYGNKLREESKATRKDTQPNYPIVVLVDPGSASASEIVAGALKNHNRAIIVGDTTFGKGSVQVIFDLIHGSALKLTIAQYLTPGDVSIQSVGIVPDIQLREVTVDEEAVDLFMSNRITREADLDAHLDHANVQKGDRPAAIVRHLKAPEPKDDAKKTKPPEDPDAFKEDFAIRFAQTMLRAAGSTSKRPDMLKKIEPSVGKMAKAEVSDIAKELKKIGVDWSEGASDPNPKLDVAVSFDRPDAILPAGDTVTLSVKATNNGQKALYRLRAVSSADNDLFDDREFLFGKLAPGESLTREVKVKIPKHMSTRYDVVSLAFGAMGTDVSKRADITVKTRSNNQPHFAFTYSIDDTKTGNGDGVLQPGESAKLRLKILNNGKGDSGKTNAYLRNLNESAFFLKTGRAEVETIKANGDHTVDFTFDVKSVPEKDHLKVEVEIFDEVFKEFTSKKLKLPASPKAGMKVKATRGTFTASKDVDVVTSAAPKSDPIAKLASGATAKVIAEHNGMYRLQLDANTSGWVRIGDGKLTRGQGPAKATYTPVVSRTAPTIAMSEPTAVTTDATYTLKGVAKDDRAVRDYYVFVHTRQDNRIKTRKVAYKASNNAKELTIDSQVPLEVGMNRIRLFVRDTEDMTTAETVYVYRKK